MSDPRRRTAELAKIHCAKRDLRLDDETYREIIRRVTGKSSSADLDDRERGRLLGELGRLGFNPTPAPAAKASKIDRSLQARKIRACWLDLKGAGLLRDSSEKALRAFIRHLTGVDAPGFLTPSQANLVIEALKAWHKRENTRRRSSGA